MAVDSKKASPGPGIQLHTDADNSHSARAITATCPRLRSMETISLIINYIVIIIICTELVSIHFGVINADRLLVSSTISGLLTIVSFKLSRDALRHLNATSEFPKANEEKTRSVAAGCDRPQ
jgi:hypothetical protein